MRRPTPVLIETDIFGDVDDVGALAVAHWCADRGDAEILGVGVNTQSRFGPHSARILNRWLGRPEIPVGIRSPLDDGVFVQDYAKRLVEEFGLEADAAEYETAVQVHRRALAASDDHSVTVVSIGFLCNLRDLLESPADSISDLDGRELVRLKVARTVVMAGRFPTGHEYNVTEDIASARAFIADWPGRVDFLGWEVGEHVISGRALSRSRGVIGFAYRCYNGAGSGRESWDLLAMHLALTDDESLYGFSEPGHVLIDSTGSTRFRPDPRGRHRHVLLRGTPADAARTLDGILDSLPQEPRLHRKPPNR